MNDFKASLNEEIGKRLESDEENSELDNASNATPDTTPHSTSKAELKSKKKRFSFKTFFAGIFLFSSILAVLASWAHLKADKTTSVILDQIPSKTAIIQTAERGMIAPTPANAQTVLTMPDARDKKPRAADGEEPDTKTPMATDTPAKDTPVGSHPHQINRASFTKQTDKPLLSFVIYDLGLSTKKTKSIIENFPKEISLSFSPYARDINELTQQAKNDGHEFWLSLPLETQRYPLNDPGPSTLLINASAEKNQSRLNDILKITEGYVGFIAPPKHQFKTEDTTVNPTIKEIFNRGYAMIDSNMALRSFISDIADRKDYPHAQSNMWLDTNITPLSLNQNIRKIVEHGENKKNIIVMLHPYPASLKTVQKFLNSKAADRFELAPVSAQLINK